MSARDRGNAYEKEVKAILEEKGYVVERALPKLVWIPGRKAPISQSHDFFGCWDLIAKKAGERTLWIQVSTWEHFSDKRKQIVKAGFPINHDVDCCAIFSRMRGGKGGGKPHYRVAYAEQDFEWNGATALVIRKPKKNADAANEQGDTDGKHPENKN